MIASLTGTLTHKDLQSVVLDVGGVGYLVSVSSQTLAELPMEGQQARLLCHTHVREDSLQIFGFLAPEERQAFELLILVSGIGPKLALTALSGMPVGELVSAIASGIASGDHKRLQRIPGVGKRTAERMVVDLKERCARLAVTSPAPAGRAAADHGAEVAEALVNLGYKRGLADKAVKQALLRLDPAAGPEKLLREALQTMAEQ
jgi:Holliday junction DNA helicase RuvA